MVGGAARDDEDLVDLAEFLIAQALLVEHDAVLVEVPQQRVGDGRGLLGDLLEHEVVVATLFGGVQVPVDMELAEVAAGLQMVVAREVGDPVAVGGEDHGLILSEFDGVAGVLDERRDVGADEHLAVADPEHQRRRTARRDDRPRIVGAGEHQREVAFEPLQHREHRGGEIARSVALGVLAGHQVHGDLGVGVAGELDARGLQFGAQGREVLDDAVVDDGDLARGVAVRVCVAVGGPAVGGPAGVAQAGAAAQAVTVVAVGLGERGLQVGQPSGAAADRQPAVAVDQGDTCGVVSAVLHPAQRVDHDVAGRAVPYVADDSTHSEPG